MDDGGALLKSILDQPDEDTPRLMYADWLEEHGQPARAEFIRAQILGRPYCVPPGVDLWELGGVIDAVPRPHLHWFNRGFVEEAQCTSSELLNYHEAMYACWPLRKLYVDCPTHSGDGGTGLSRFPAHLVLRAIRVLCLRVDVPFSRHDARMLLADYEQHQWKLIELGVYSSSLDPGACSALFAALPHLWLDFNGSVFTPADGITGVKRVCVTNDRNEVPRAPQRMRLSPLLPTQ